MITRPFGGLQSRKAGLLIIDSRRIAFAAAFVLTGCYVSHERGVIDGGREIDGEVADAGACDDCADMVYVPAGPFMMGCAPDDWLCPRVPAESPYHEVLVSAFHIERTEVTREAFGACVDAGTCSDLERCEMRSPSEVAPDEPAVCVDWNQAMAYCGWRGRRLCTEAEWEKAARGTDELTFPWGNDAPSCERSVYFDCHQSFPDPVGTHPLGASPYGVEDMAGNVWEWVRDWYGGDYYSESPRVDPPGPTTGRGRVLRGGAFDNNEADIRTSFRGASPPDERTPHVGFRCCS